MSEYHIYEVEFLENYIYGDWMTIYPFLSSLENAVNFIKWHRSQYTDDENKKHSYCITRHTLDKNDYLRTYNEQGEEV